MTFKCVSFHADYEDWVELQKHSLDIKNRSSASSITRELIKKKLKEIKANK